MVTSDRWEFRSAVDGLGREQLRPRAECRRTAGNDADSSDPCGERLSSLWWNRGRPLSGKLMLARIDAVKARPQGRLLGPYRFAKLFQRLQIIGVGLRVSKLGCPVSTLGVELVEQGRVAPRRKEYSLMSRLLWAASR